MPEPFRTHRGIVAPLDRANIDTDAIIPKQFLKSISRTGFGPHLFTDWRHASDGKPNPDFSLNQPRYAKASILVVRSNFGCGSSREHAVWAVQQAGFKAVVAPSFADIFRNNSVKNGLLTIELAEPEVEEVFQMVERYAGLEATVDLDHQRLTLHLPEEISFHFEIEASVKEHLIHGLDEIGLTLKYADAISSFEARHDAQLTPT